MDKTKARLLLLAVFIIKASKAGKEASDKPEMKHEYWTHFIR